MSDWNERSNFQITEEPSQIFRCRYYERSTHGVLHGRGTNTFPQVKWTNVGEFAQYNFYIHVELLNSNTQQLSPHYLVLQRANRDNPDFKAIFEELNRDSNNDFVFTLKNYLIRRVKAVDEEKVLRVKRDWMVQKFGTEFLRRNSNFFNSDQQANISNSNTNNNKDMVVSLIFNIFVQTCDGHYEHCKGPLISQKIYNNRGVSIHKLCNLRSEVCGNVEITILVSELRKKDLKCIYIFEIDANTNETLWNATVGVKDVEIYQNCAATFRLPRYCGPNTAEEIHCYIEIHCVNGMKCNPIKFLYINSSSGGGEGKRKRPNATSNQSSQLLPESSFFNSNTNSPYSIQDSSAYNSQVNSPNSMYSTCSMQSPSFSQNSESNDDQQIQLDVAAILSESSEAYNTGTLQIDGEFFYENASSLEELFSSAAIFRDKCNISETSASNCDSGNPKKEKRKTSSNSAQAFSVQVDKYEEAFEKGVDPNIIADYISDGHEGNTFFHDALKYGQVEKALRLVEAYKLHSILLKALNAFRETLLHYECSQWARPNVVSALLHELNFSLTDQDIERNTPMHLLMKRLNTTANTKERDSILQCLDQFAILIQNTLERSPASRAAEVRNLLDCYDLQGFTVFHLAVMSGLEDLIIDLILFCNEMSIDIEKYRILQNGYTIVHLAVQCDSLRMLQKILEILPGARNYENYAGETIESSDFLERENVTPQMLRFIEENLN